MRDTSGMYISKDWTVTERLLLIWKTRAEGGAQELIRYLEEKPAAFLEANREAIIKGKAFQ
jgi:hypothetical protein